jgi:hypothetical protein
MATFQLSNSDARLTFLAIQYHLARPGSELDAETKQPSAHGLRSVAEALEPQLDLAVATIEMDDEQTRRLDAALAGTVNELKAYPLMAASGGRGAPGFREALQRLFPVVAGDPEEAAQLAGHVMALRRKLEGSLAAEPGQVGQDEPRGWRRLFGRSKG